jgi:hypothetical protein
MRTTIGVGLAMWMVAWAGCEAPLGGGGDADLGTVDREDSGGGGGGGGGDGATVDPPTPFDDGVTLTLVRREATADVARFALPVPRGRLADVSTLVVEKAGAPVALAAREILADYDANGARRGVRALVAEIPASALDGDRTSITLHWTGATAAPAMPSRDFLSSSTPSSETVRTVTRTITSAPGGGQLVESNPQTKTLFTAREPNVFALFPEGYLGATRIVGPVVTAARAAAPEFAGIAPLSTALRRFTTSAMYSESYALNPDPESVVDPLTNFEGWLYDRCATFLVAHAHTGDEALLRHALRSCSHYAGKIDTTTGANRGIFTGKPDPDTKYSHLRGLYAYYAVTGDEAALAAGRAIADLWLNDTLFVGPYRRGMLRGIDKLWTERLLGTSMEGLYYGWLLTGDRRYRDAFLEMLATAHRHVTGDAAALAAINPGVSFPPQSCFIHTAEQHAEGNRDEPWCSSWMSELLIDVLVRASDEIGGDVREKSDEIFVRLARFLRDVGSAYFTSDLQADSFLKPSVCDRASDGENRRRLVPLYGAGIDAAGMRRTFGEYSDFEHCADATALTAAALRALVRRGTYNQNPVAPFSSEGESFLALHEELASCAMRTFDENSRPHRDPATWTAAELGAGVSSPATFIRTNKIGYPKYPTSPQRKLSWWFNMSMLEFALLDEANIQLPSLRTGRVQPASCP